MKFFGRFLFLLGAIGLLICGVVLAWFASWRNDRLEELHAGGTLMDVEAGRVEYALSDTTGPAVLVFHGAPGGYDQGLALGRPLAEAGFTIIAPSRPGYLQTPLSSGILIEEQSDLMAEMLDTLGIESVAVLGFAEGAAFAADFCLRHPERVRAAAFVSPIVLRADERSWNRALLPGERLNERLTGDIGAWVFARRAEKDPAAAWGWFLSEDTDLTPEETAKEQAFLDRDRWQRNWAVDFFRSLTPLGPRESGLRNDTAQIASLRKLDFSQIEIPVLVLSGSADTVVPKADAEAIAEQAPDCEPVVITGAGALVFLGGGGASAINRLVAFFQTNAR